MSTEMSLFLSSAGVEHQTTIPATPEQNGVAERFNRTLLDMARSMIHGAGLSKKFWGEATMSANYIRVRCSTTSVKDNKCPLELWTGIKPSIQHLRVFGCKVSVHVPDHQREKLDAHSWTGILVGYSSSQKGYRIWDSRRECVVTSQNLVFYESDLVRANLQDLEAPWEHDLPRSPRGAPT